MSDFIWFIIIAVLFFLLGLIFIVLGWLIWKKQKINLIIRYHCEKVREENKQAYCKLFGMGILVIGVGFLLSGVCTPFTQSVFSFVPMTVGLVLGMVLIVFSVIRYNKDRYGSLRVFFTGVWGCDVELFFEGDVSYCTESRNPENYDPYWGDSQVAFTDGFIVFYDDSETDVKDINDNWCWFKARKMSYRILPL